MVVNSRRAEHAADTRRGLVTAARRSFAANGYAATSLDEVCRRARVTKGALYHHFRNKEELFVAVLEEVEEQFVRAGSAAVEPGAGVWEALRAASAGFLDVCSRGDVRRVVIEAPAVLGWERCRQVENEHAVAFLGAALEAAVREGQLVSDAPHVLAQLLAAVFNEAGMAVAAAKEPEAVRPTVQGELDLLLHGLERASDRPASPVARGS